MLKRVKLLLEAIERGHGLAPVDRLGHKLAKKGLTSAPFIASIDAHTADSQRVRVDTVHQVKGESLDAVLYLTTRAHADALLAGVHSEDGRIGYVAVTRARDLFWLGIPESALPKLRTRLVSHGFREHKQ